VIDHLSCGKGRKKSPVYPRQPFSVCRRKEVEKRLPTLGGRGGGDEQCLLRRKEREGGVFFRWKASRKKIEKRITDKFLYEKKGEAGSGCWFNMGEKKGKTEGESHTHPQRRGRKICA